jgi:uncharacterized protein with gpF-like domain
VEVRFDIKSALRSKRKKTIKAKRGVPYSKMLEADFYRSLSFIVKTIKERFENMVIKGLDLKHVKEVVEDESISARVERLIKAWRKSIEVQFHKDRIKNLAQTYVKKADRYQKAKFKTVVEYGFGIDISNMPEFKAYRQFINLSVSNNVQKITSLKEETINRLESELRRAIEQGTSIEQLVRKIRADEVSRKRAVMIARNEIKNVTSMLSKKRLQNAGFTTYVWSTAEDRRVRGNPSGTYPKAIPNHWIMNDLLCKFEDDTVYSDNEGQTWKKRTAKMPDYTAGEAINCRCVAIPFVKIEED